MRETWWPALLLFGQFLAERFSVLLASAGLVLWLGLMTWAVALVDGGEQ